MKNFITKITEKVGIDKITHFFCRSNNSIISNFDIVLRRKYFQSDSIFYNRNKCFRTMWISQGDM